MSVGTFLHLLLFYAHIIIIIINFVSCDGDIKSDFNHFESKYFSENDTYNNNKRLIIEDFYRQSAISVKNIKDISFHINASNININNNNNSNDFQKAPQANADDIMSTLATSSSSSTRDGKHTNYLLK